MNEALKKVEGVNELIPVFSGEMSGQQVQLCNARDLHAFLQVKKDFSTWIKDRIETYGFIEGEEFKLDSPNLVNRENQGLTGFFNGTNAKTRKDYHLALDTAKELAMVEKNEQGKLARRYFIQCEKKMRDNSVQLPREIEKACDYSSWKLSNDYQQNTMKLLGNAARPNDDEVIGHAVFLIKRRLYDELKKAAQDMLNKNVPENEVYDWILTWKQSSQSGGSSLLC